MKPIPHRLATVLVAALYLTSTWMFVYLMLFLMTPVLSAVRGNADFISGVIQTSVGMMVLFTIIGTVATVVFGAGEFFLPAVGFHFPFTTEET